MEPGEKRVVPFTISVPSDASPGHLEYDDGQLALLEGAEARVVHGQPEVKGKTKEFALPHVITTIVPAREEASWSLFALLGVLAIVIVVSLYLITRRLAKRWLAR